MTDAKDLITALSDTRISAFIDFGRLAKSPSIIEMAEFSAKHAIDNGDRGYLEKTLNIFKGTKYFPPLLQWLCLRVGLEGKYKNGSLVLRKSSLAPDQSIQLRDLLSNTSIEPKKPSKEKPSAQPKAFTVAKKKKRLKKIDMLDSWTRLPGSFGAGKKR